MVRRGPAIITEPGTPQWFVRFTGRLGGMFQEKSPTSPTQPFRCLSTAAPDPKLTPYGVALFTDIPTLVFSTGTAWVRADGSAV